MRAALAIRLKDKMGTDKIEQREKELLSLCFHQLRQIPNLYILGSTEEKRIGCISFTIKNIHYNLIVRLLNDRFGIQLRGGWSCASTYGHYLFDFDKDRSGKMVDGLKKRDLTHKPGWVRLSLHPITTNRELFFICDAIKQVAQYSEVWGRDYSYNRATNEFEHMDGDLGIVQHTKDWFVI